MIASRIAVVFSTGIAVVLLAPSLLRADTSVVDAPFFTTDSPNNASVSNVSYVGNRAPLAPSRFISLPPGSVKPAGWLREMLDRQRKGLTGNLGKISAWLQKEDNAWLSKDGRGQYGWEELPYWLKGYIELAYLFDDADMIAESQIWIEGTLASQRPNGDFGPQQRLGDGNRDYWANMVMLFCLQSYYEHSVAAGQPDDRVLDLMTRYFEYQLTVPDDQMLTGYWQRMRGGDNLQSIYWLYNRTGNAELLKVAEKIHRCTADWRLKGTLPNWHNVNIAECFREPATYYLQSLDPNDLQAAYNNFHEIRKRFGQVPGGMFGGDENSRPGFDDPRQATETCGFVEQMLSDAIMMQISGDPFWADHCEDVAFNSYPAAVMPDFRALRYLTAPNMVLSDAENHSPGIENRGPFLMMNPFSSRCCQHNHSHGWPYFAKHLWMATPDNGVCASMYSAGEVNVKVAEGVPVRFTETTKYPFEDTIVFEFHSEQSTTFPLYLRVPSWCKDAHLTINGKQEETSASRGRYLRVNRQWNDGDTVTLQLPMSVSLRTWKRNHDSVSVDYGPLTFSLKIGEQYVKKSSVETAIGDSHWQAGVDTSQWPSFEIHPTTSWNYGLVLDKDNVEKSFKFEHHEWPEDDFPFTIDSAPITLSARAKPIPQWTIDQHGLCAVLQDSPVRSDQPTETVTLVPMGAARLRISAFPVIGEGADAETWVEPPKPHKSTFEISASHVYQGDSCDAIDDGLVPNQSADRSIPRFTWWDHRGTSEWVQYVFPEQRRVSQVEVYWFDDTGIGECRIPESWTVLVRDGEQWKPVNASDMSPVVADQWNRTSFEPVETTAIRIQVKLQPGFSGGVLEWRVGNGQE
ncbi:hypothetical protein CA13_11880 [Planctomycetes bacterium CA13]|uniref:Non-reducing end beta-L-arabinofuranosidase n=1 Tax=Novipirellula herctigrandis TaxID=2527986 RepID=A0A5C5YYV0_9BACT|nr:hypothetical protein CA13_11880 [Planctomycetes bacterium CA13]